MASVDTLVKDLNTGAITRVGAMPRADQEDGFALLSKDRNTRYAYANVDVTVKDDSFSCQASEAKNHKGRYLHYEDNYATVSPIDAQHPIVVSGNFSGCAYKVYKDENLFYCLHIARPGDTSPDRYVTGVAALAKERKWKEIQSVPTVGYANKDGCTSVMLVSQLDGGNINSILLKMGRGGGIVGKQLYTASLS